VLFSQHGGFVWRALKRQRVPDRELEDACQEVFLVAHRREADFEGRSSPRTWLYGIALRVALSFRRRAHVQREQLTSELPETGSDAPQQHDQLERKERLSWLQGVLAALDDDKREAFVLYELEGMNLAEVAAATGVPEGTALYRLHQARDEVKRRSKRAEVVASVEMSSAGRSAGRRA
jgi:RNA polymerase sigma-70 factor (ECF subfamily)